MHTIPGCVSAVANLSKTLPVRAANTGQDVKGSLKCSRSLKTRQEAQPKTLCTFDIYYMGTEESNDTPPFDDDDTPSSYPRSGTL